MHDRRQPGREPTVVVDDPIESTRPLEELVEEMRLDDLTTEGLAPQDTAECGTEPDGLTCPEGTPTDEPESAFARRAKLIALAVATTALVASAVAAASIAGDDQDNGSPPVHERGIDGAAALGGFVVPSSDRSPTAPARPVVATAATAGSQAALAAQPATASPARPSASTGAAAGATSPSGAQPDDADADDIGKPRADSRAATDPVTAAREFYALVASSPEAALSRVAPEVIGADGQRLLASWRSMTSVSVDHAEEQRPGTVRVIVTMSRPNENPLRIIQLLSFDDGAQPMIDGATLLSIDTL